MPYVGHMVPTPTWIKLKTDHFGKNQKYGKYLYFSTLLPVYLKVVPIHPLIFFLHPSVSFSSIHLFRFHFQSFPSIEKSTLS